MVVSHEAKRKQHARVSLGLRDHYSKLFTQMAALKFENAVTPCHHSSFAYLITDLERSIWVESTTHRWNKSTQTFLRTT